MVIDQITLHNKDEVFAYEGSVNGRYVWQRGNTVEVGTYEDGAPRITDGLFRVAQTITFSSTSAAQKAALEAAGARGVLSLVLGEAAYAAADGTVRKPNGTV